MMNKKIGTIILGLIVAFIVVSWIGTMIVSPEANPEPHYDGIVVSEKSDEILKESCFDCHSNETVWPWYNHVPPMSFLVHFDVAEGREHLNFSHWETVSTEDKIDALDESVEEIEEGHMPLPPYLILHGAAAIDEAELKTLKADIEAKINELRKGDGE